MTSSHTLRRSAVRRVLLMLTVAAIGPSLVAAPPSHASVAGDAAIQRAPARHSERTTSFEWLSDVQERLRILDEHAAAAVRRHMQQAPGASQFGRFAPLPPETGDGAQR